MGLLFILFYFFSEVYFSLYLIDKYSFLDFFLYSLSSFFLGFFLMAVIGRGVLQSIQGDLLQGKLPEKSIINKGLLFFGAFLIFLPGALNDIFAVICILPGLRHIAGYLLKRSLNNKMKSFGGFSYVKFGSNQFGQEFTRTNNQERDARVIEIEPLSIEHSDEKNRP